MVSTDRCEGLSKIILGEHDIGTLEEAIVAYGRSCYVNDAIKQVCDRNIFEREVPGLTAACLRALERSGRLDDAYFNIIKSFIDIDRYDEWYDETVFSLGFYYDLPDGVAKNALSGVVGEFVHAAADRGDAELIEFCQQRSMR